MVTRHWRGGENRKFMFNRYRVSVEDDGKVLEMDGGDDCKIM